MGRVQVSIVVCAALILGCAAEFNPDLSSLEGSETTSDVGSAGDSSQTDSSDSTTESTDETESTGDGDGDEGTETGDDDSDGDLQTGDSCDPILDMCPVGDTCTYGTVDPDDKDYWFFFCEPLEELPGTNIGDTCFTWGQTNVCINSYCASVNDSVNVAAYCGANWTVLFEGCCVPYCHADEGGSPPNNFPQGECPGSDFNACEALGAGEENTQGIGWCMGYNP